MTTPTDPLDLALRHAVERCADERLSVTHWARTVHAATAWRAPISEALGADAAPTVAALLPHAGLRRGALLAWAAEHAVLVRDPAAEAPVALVVSRDDLRKGSWGPLIRVEPNGVQGTLAQRMTRTDQTSFARWLDVSTSEPTSTSDAPADGAPTHWHETLSAQEPADASADVVDAAEAAPDSGLAAALSDAGLHTGGWWVAELASDLDGAAVTGVVDGSRGLVVLTDPTAVVLEVAERAVTLARYPLGTLRVHVGPADPYPDVRVDDGLAAPDRTDLLVADIGEVDADAAARLTDWAARAPGPGSPAPVATSRLSERSLPEPTSTPTGTPAAPGTPGAPTPAPTSLREALAMARGQTMGPPVELGREELRGSDAWRSAPVDPEKVLKTPILQDVLSRIAEDETLETVVATDGTAGLLFLTDRSVVVVEERVRVTSMPRPVHDVVLAKDGLRRRQLLLASADREHSVHLHRVDRETAEWLASRVRQVP